MIDEGAGAPEFTLPAVVGDEIESVSLSDYLGRDVVVLAFYPGDFNPACDGQETDLDELDLFTMQKDVSILGVAGDSVFAHRAFADEYDLNVPLLSDVDGEVAEAYGVGVADPDAGYQTRRAVVVVSPQGDVEYAWSTDDLRELPPVDHVREAVEAVGGAQTARARYRLGHAHYVEGRRAFTSAMQAYGDNEWMLSETDFRRAYEEFDEANELFNSAVRFGEDDHEIEYFELAEDKAEILWQAAEWLADAANAYASGEGAEAESMREDAEKPLEEARRYPEPPAPDDFPPDEPAPELEDPEADRESFLPDDEDDVDTSLDVDFDEAEGAEDLRESVDDQGDPDATEAGTPDGAPTASTGQDGGASASGQQGDAADAEGEGDAEAEDEIDDAELEEITAELEEQTEQAQAREVAAEADQDADDEQAAPDDGVGSEDNSATDADEMADGTGGGEAGGSNGDEGDGVSGEEADGEAGGAEPEEDVEELELTDPTGGEGLDPLEDEDEEEGDVEDEEKGDVEDEEKGDVEDPDEDLGDGGGSHGVPDSL